MVCADLSCGASSRHKNMNVLCMNTVCTVWTVYEQIMYITYIQYFYYVNVSFDVVMDVVFLMSCVSHRKQCCCVALLESCCSFMALCVMI